jgi:hypothetical protein
MIGILHHCLATHTKYDEHTAFGHRRDATRSSTPAVA